MDTLKKMTSHDILRNSEGRVTLAVIKISYTFDFRYHNSNKYLQYLIFHQMIHILGFSYESFERFPGGKDSTYNIESEDSSDSTKIRAYIALKDDERGILKSTYNDLTDEEITGRRQKRCLKF